MGTAVTERFKTWVKNAKADKHAVPPGFVSLTSFTLKRLRNSEETYRSIASGVEAELAPADITSSINDIEKIKRSVKHRPWILYDQYSHNPEESDSEQLDMSFPSKTCLSKGVIRRCEKVAARWHPEEACMTVLEEAPVFYPSEEEFKDTLNYIASIRLQAEPCGICRIVPPPSWRPPCLLKEKNTWGISKFSTCIQRINELQRLCSEQTLNEFHERNKGKRGRNFGTSLECISSHGSKKIPDEGGCYNEGFDFEPGPEFTLESFKKYADNFKKQYFCMEGKVSDLDVASSEIDHCWEPSVENIEGEYRRIIDNPTEHVEVLYGADLESRVLGGGFPVVSDSAEMSEYHEYEKSGWNLNNIPKLPGSLLAFQSNETSSILLPRLFIGMCFSSLCWRVEEHNLYSLYYMHLGAPKVWYGVPGRCQFKFEEALKKYFPNLLAENPELLHKKVMELSPSVLKSEGIPVYRCVQNPGEFALVFPGSYHTGFDCGFNCTEKANFAPFDWLPHGQNAVELYGERGRKTSISYDKLLIGAAQEAVRAHWERLLLRNNSEDNLRWQAVCGKDGILAKALKSRIKQEFVRRQYLCDCSQTQKILEVDSDSTSKRECSICLYDLQLSAAGCSCSPDRYVCLKHTKQLCSCAWSNRFFLFRYPISRLDVLAEALEGKLSSVCKWNLGQTLHSSIPRDNGISRSSDDAAMTNSICRSSASDLCPEMEMEPPLLQSTSSSKLKDRENTTASLVRSAEVLFDTYPARMKELSEAYKLTSSSSGSGPVSSASDKQITEKSSCLQNCVVVISDDDEE